MSGPDEPVDTGVATQAGIAVVALVEAWLRDSTYAAVGLFSLAIAFCGFAVAGGPGYGALGIAAGLVAVAIPTVAVVRRSRASRIWLAILGGALLDAAALALFLTRQG